MPVHGSFGPSTGRLVEVGESSDTRVKMNTRETPPVAWILSLTTAFLSFVFGATLLYENETILGLLLMIFGVILLALPVLLAIENRR